MVDFNFTVNTFCVSTLWNTNLTWYPQNGQPPDFTPCFHKTVLVYLPSLFLFLLSPIEFVRNNAPGTGNPIPWASLNILKLILKLLLCCSAVFEEIVLALIVYNNKYPIVGADFVGPAVKLAAYILSIILMFQAKKSGIVTSPSQWFYWLLHTICQGFTFGSVVNNPSLTGLTWTVPQDVIVVFNFSCIFLLLVLYSIAEKGQTYTKIQGIQITRHKLFLFDIK